MREFDRDLISGGQYGQRSYESRQKAGHMAAPTNAAKREESPCQPGAVHTGPETVMVVIPPGLSIRRFEFSSFYSNHMLYKLARSVIHVLQRIN
jgi:hypothetical protein